jgi:hypothetical protein
VKTKRLLLTVFASAMVLASTYAWADEATYMVIKSPDHPQTWYSGALLASKKLRWDPKRHVLLADIVFSTQEYSDRTDPPEWDYHTVVLPGIHLAGNGVDLIATNARGQTALIGQVKNSLLGKAVYLNEHVNFDVHRENGGLIYTSLTFNRLMTYN